MTTYSSNHKKRAGNVTVKELSNTTYYSERQLNRIFRKYVGLNAKSFLRLIRVNTTFHLLKKQHNSLTFVSDATGFHDLPHFIHDFKLVCGITPQEYRNNMSAFYNNPIKF
ncbi:MAG: helix-turn-helix domain-containing protein [Coprobacillaceae bacterium]